MLKTYVLAFLTTSVVLLRTLNELFALTLWTTLSWHLGSRFWTAY